MATVLLEADISGIGSASLAANMVEFALFSVNGLDDRVDYPYPTITDVFRKAGWIAFGKRRTLILDDEIDYWLPPIYLNYSNQLFLPDPSAWPGNTDFALDVDQIRWALLGTTTVHVYVSGA